MPLNTLFINLVVTFSLFSGGYIVGGVKVYPPLGFAVLGYCLTLSSGKLPVVIYRELKWWGGGVLLMLSCYFFGQSSDYLFILSRYLFKAVAIPLGCCLLIRKIALRYGPHEYSKRIINAVYFALFFQLIITALQLSLPTFHSAFNRFIELTDEWKTLADMGHFRATGLSGLSIYDTSIAYGLLYLLFLPWCVSEKYWLNYKFLLITVIIIMLSLISGRSGFILVTIVCFFFIIFSSRKIFYLVNLSCAITVVIFIVIAIVGYKQFYIFSQFVFEPIFNFFDKGTFETASTNELMDSYLFIPWDVNPFTGMGVWAQPSISISDKLEYATDSGIILNYIAFGMLGLIFIVSYTVHFWLQYANNIQMNKPLTRSLFCVFLGVLIFSFILKGPIFFSEKIMTAYFIWLILNISVPSECQK